MLPFTRVYLPSIDRVSSDNYKARVLKVIAIRNYGRKPALERANTY